MVRAMEIADIVYGIAKTGNEAKSMKFIRSFYYRGGFINFHVTGEDHIGIYDPVKRTTKYVSVFFYVAMTNEPKTPFGKDLLHRIRGDISKLSDGRLFHNQEM